MNACPICGNPCRIDSKGRERATCGNSLCLGEIARRIAKDPKRRENVSRAVSRAMRGWVPSEETRLRMSEAKKGKPGTWTGRRHSEETKRKMSEAAKNRKPQYRSKGEKEMVGFIRGIYSGRVFENYRKLFPHKAYELDVYLPELGLAFEYNGDYCHGPKFPKAVARDFWKQEHAKDLGVQIHFIWDSDWKHHNQETKNFIIEMVGG